MNIGVFSFTGDAPFLETGVTTYNRVLLKALCEFGSNNQYSVYFSKSNSKRYSDLNFPNLRKIDLEPDFFKTKMMKYGYLRPLGIIAFCFFINRSRFLSSVISRLYGFHLPQENSIDLLIYTTYGFLPYLPLFVKFSAELPFIAVIHDIRRIIFSKRNIDTRVMCLYTKYLIQYSTLVIVPSTFIKEKLIEYYKVPESKIRVLFSIPEVNFCIKESKASLDTVIEKYNLPSKFLFFPSTILDTKNHLRLIKAIKALKEKGVLVNLILSGTVGDRHLFEKIKKQIFDLGLSKIVRYIGFISEEEKIAMFKLATSLIMPTIGESFSIPIWEAFYLGCPVTSSNLYDMPEQVKDAALSFDPFSIEDMADRIYEIWTDEDLRQELIRKGCERVKGLTLENYAKHWERIIEEALQRIRK